MGLLGVLGFIELNGLQCCFDGLDQWSLPDFSLNDDLVVDHDHWNSVLLCFERGSCVGNVDFLELKIIMVSDFRDDELRVVVQGTARLCEKRHNGLSDE